MKNYIIEELQNNIDNELISFHVPGHKSGKIYELLGYTDILNNIYKMDTTEIIGTDNLHSPEGIISKSQERASRVFKSEKTYYLIDGSTCGVQAAILAVCNPKDKIIVNRDCHQSVISACVLGEVEPVYLKPEINEEYNISIGVSLCEIKKTIDKNKDAKAILLTYPSYYGNTYNLNEICKYAHENNLVVIVDEAHGSHLGLSDDLPKTALEQGADIVIQSTHKTLPAFTQSSMLHTQGNLINKEKIEVVLRMIQSSSPSYLLLSSLELAVDIYDKNGNRLMNELLDNIELFKSKFAKNASINILNDDDKTKVYISLKNIGLTGYELEIILREEHNIQIELSNYYGVLLVCTLGNEKEDFKILENSLIDIIDSKKKNKKLTSVKYPNIIPKKVISPREAFYKPKKSVKIENSEGKICGENIVPYPPGISIISPGEVITKDIIEYLHLCIKEGMNISGIKDTKFEYIQVIENR